MVMVLLGGIAGWQAPLLPAEPSCVAWHPAFPTSSSLPSPSVCVLPLSVTACFMICQYCGCGGGLMHTLARP